MTDMTKMQKFIYLIKNKFIMRKNQYYKFKFLIWTTLAIILLNSYMWYEFSVGFFTTQTRLFLFILFNQIYFAFAGVVLYLIIKLEAIRSDMNQLEYIIRRLKK